MYRVCTTNQGRMGTRYGQQSFSTVRRGWEGGSMFLLLTGAQDTEVCVRWSSCPSKVSGTSYSTGYMGCVCMSISGTHVYDVVCNASLYSDPHLSVQGVGHVMQHRLDGWVLSIWLWTRDSIYMLMCGQVCPLPAGPRCRPCHAARAGCAVAGQRGRPPGCGGGAAGVGEHAAPGHHARLGVSAVMWMDGWPLSPLSPPRGVVVKRGIDGWWASLTPILPASRVDIQASYFQVDIGGAYAVASPPCVAPISTDIQPRTW